MDSVLIPNGVGTSWHFASTASALSFFFHDCERLQCQARAKSTKTQECSHILVKQRGSIEKLLHSIHTVSIPSNDLSLTVLALSDIALCHRAGHKGPINIHQVRNRWCKKLRGRCRLDTNHSYSEAIECLAEEDQHGSPSCWMFGISSQHTRRNTLTNLETLPQIHIDEQNISIPRQPIRDYAKLSPLLNHGEQDKQTVEPYMPLSDGPYVDLNTSHLQATIGLPLRLKSTNLDNPEETTRQVQILGIHPEQGCSTPTKHKHRPELHRSDIRTITSGTSHLYDNPWIDNPAATPGASSSLASSEYTSTPLSTYSTTSPTFDEPSAHSNTPDTPLTELTETSWQWGMCPLPQLGGAGSPSAKTWKSRDNLSAWHGNESSERSSVTEDDLQEGIDFEDCDDFKVPDSNPNGVIKLLFQINDRKDAVASSLDADLFKPIKRVQTTPVRDSKERDLEWNQRLPSRRRSIHELPSQTVSGSSEITDWKSCRLVQQRHRRDSLPQNITENELLSRFYDRNDDCKEEREYAMDREVIDPEDDYDEEEIGQAGDNGAPRTGAATAATHVCFTQTKPQQTKVLCPRPAAFQTWTQSDQPLRELWIKMRQTINSREMLKPGYVYCYERCCQPGYLKIGHVRVSVAQYEQDLAMGLAYCQQPIPTGAVKRSPTPPRSVAGRMRRLKSSCKYEPQVVYWSPVAYSAFTIEQLVHQHLVAYRKREIKCNGCNGGHTEWFEVNLQEAKHAVDLWCQFAKLKPYVDGGLQNPWLARTLPPTDPKLDKTAESLSVFLGWMSVWIETEKRVRSNEMMDVAQRVEIR